MSDTTMGEVRTSASALRTVYPVALGLRKYGWLAGGFSLLAVSIFLASCVLMLVHPFFPMLLLLPGILFGGCLVVVLTAMQRIGSLKDGWQVFLDIHSGYKLARLDEKKARKLIAGKEEYADECFLSMGYGCSEEARASSQQQMLGYAKMDNHTADLLRRAMRIHARFARNVRETVLNWGLTGLRNHLEAHSGEYVHQMERLETLTSDPLFPTVRDISK